MNIKELIAENDSRKVKFTQNYNPETGEGSLLPRIPLHIEEIGDFMIPYVMISIPLIGHLLETGSLRETCPLMGWLPTDENIEVVRGKFEDSRYSYDV